MPPVTAHLPLAHQSAVEDSWDEGLIVNNEGLLQRGQHGANPPIKTKGRDLDKGAMGFAADTTKEHVNSCVKSHC